MWKVLSPLSMWLALQSPRHAVHFISLSPHNDTLWGWHLKHHWARKLRDVSDGGGACASVRMRQCTSRRLGRLHRGHDTCPDVHGQVEGHWRHKRPWLFQVEGKVCSKVWRWGTASTAMEITCSCICSLEKSGGPFCMYQAKELRLHAGWHRVCVYVCVQWNFSLRPCYVLYQHVFCPFSHSMAFFHQRVHTLHGILKPWNTVLLVKRLDLILTIHVLPAVISSPYQCSL